MLTAFATQGVCSLHTFSCIRLMPIACQFTFFVFRVATPVFEPKEKKKKPKKNPLLEKPYTELKRGKEAAKKSNDMPTVLLYLMPCDQYPLILKK